MIKVKMKKLESTCGIYTEKWNKKASWDYLCIGKDSYLNGYKDAIKEVLANFHKLPYNDYTSIEILIKTSGQEIVEVEMAGTQIGAGNE